MTRESMPFRAIATRTATALRRWRAALGPWWRDFQWPVMGVLALLSMVLGHVGYVIQFRVMPEAAYSFWDILYLDMQLPLLQLGEVEPPFNVALNVARFLAPAVAGYTALQALGELFAGELQSMRLRFWRGHVVVCGLGRKGLILARGFLERGARVVVIEQDTDNDLLTQCRDLGAVVLIGDAAEDWLLRKAGVVRAAHVLALCGDDGVNAEIAVSASRLVAGSSGPPVICALHIFDPQLCTLLRERELDASSRLRMVFFNVFELGARVLLEENPVWFPGRSVEGVPSRMIIVGLGKLAESLLVNAARQWHARAARSTVRLHVTMIDLHARDILATWRVRYPALERSCELVPMDMDVRSAAFHQAGFLNDGDPVRQQAAVFVCLDDESLGLSAALALGGRTQDGDPAIVVRMAQEAGLAVLLRDTDDACNSFRHLRAFALLDRACRPELVLQGTHEILARSIHGEYLSQHDQTGDASAREASLVPWDSLSTELKAANYAQADAIMAKLQAVRCGLAPLTDWDEPVFAFNGAEIEHLARMEHARWVAEMQRTGWRHGPTKDHEAKTHPCLVSHDDLPPEEQEKDRHTVRQIPVMLAKAGFRVHRLGVPVRP